ncbi:MAG: hypothetical protein M0P64_00080 [Candidatus Pacebacteria bacterium]|jgi:hypothetical protein|nr:hypothetical protein [Candidatus Paceibacterota bacterium]
MFESFEPGKGAETTSERAVISSAATGDTWQDEAVANFERSKAQAFARNVDEGKIERGDPVEKRFAEELFGLSADSKYAQSLFSNLLEYGLGQNEFENIFENVSQYQLLQEEISKKSPSVEHLLCILGDGEIGNSDRAAALVSNNNERHRVIEKNQQDLGDRMSNNPKASDLEYRLGAYAEAIEPQVRYAVFQLLEKGYSPFESGFFDLPTGAQYVGFNKNSTINFAYVTETINKNFDEEYKKLFSQIRVDERGDRIQIILVPKVRTMPLGVWRLAWNSLVASMPDVSSESNKEMIVDNGLQGKIFREKQDKLSEVEN